VLYAAQFRVNKTVYISDSQHMSLLSTECCNADGFQSLELISNLEAGGICHTVVLFNVVTIACRVSVGKFEGKRLLGRSRRRWDNNIKMHGLVLSS